jgi:hypothetical protein
MRWRRRRNELMTVEPPRWSTPQLRPRILIEHVDLDVREPLANALDERGYDVVTCPGPRGGMTCPVLHGRPCYALDDTDAVITGLAYTAEGRAIAAHVARTRPGLPLLIEGTATMLDHLDVALLERTVHPPTADTFAPHLPPPAATVASS